MPTFPHIPLAASARFRGKSANGLYGDVVAELDWSVGELLSALKKHDIEKDTIVMFSSDNGPWFQGSPGRLRGRKGSTNEGGVREPFLAKWPGHIPKGIVCNGVAGTIDILPTLASLCEVPLPGNPVDGIGIGPLLMGRRQDLERDVLLYFDNWNLQCARWRQWKLHLSRYTTMAHNPAPAGGRVNLALPSPELYDLNKNPDESYDVAAQHSDVVARIRGRVEALLPGFPDEVKMAWDATCSRPAANTATGALPRPVQKQ